MTCNSHNTVSIIALLDYFPVLSDICPINGENGGWELHAEATEMQGNQKPKQGGKVRLLTLADLDSRTRACKHALGLRDGFLADLGGTDNTSIAERELAQRASILGAMLEDTEAKWLSGEPVELGEYATLTNAQRRVLSDLGIERRARDVTPISEYLRLKADEARKDSCTEAETA